MVLSFKINIFFKKIINFWEKDVKYQKVKLMDYEGGSHKK